MKSANTCKLHHTLLRRGVVVVTTAQLHSKKAQTWILRHFKSYSWRVGRFVMVKISDNDPG